MFLKETIRAQKNALQKKDNEIASLKQDSGASEHELKERDEAEKKQTVRNLENVIDEMQRQWEGHHKDIQKLADELAQSEKRRTPFAT
jgi:uncharacterized protein YukE